MLKRPTKNYTVKSKHSGRVIVSGNAAVCAKALGIPLDHFYVIAQRAMTGAHKNYEISAVFAKREGKASEVRA